MDPERWQRVGSIYNTALERQPDARGAFLEEACTGDEALAQDWQSYPHFSDPTHDQIAGLPHDTAGPQQILS